MVANFCPPNRACSSFSGRRNVLVLSDLYDGISIFRLSPYHFHFDTVTVENNNNIAVPVEIINDDESLLFGSPVGKVGYTELLLSSDGRRTFHYLTHDGALYATVLQHVVNLAIVFRG